MSASRPRVLVLEDEPSVRENLCAYFEDEGHTVVCAASAEEALEAVSSGDLDVAIVDIRLPGMSGDEFIVRARQLAPSMRFIVYTGSLNFEVSQHLVPLDGRELQVIFKPVLDMKVLAAAVARAAGERSGEDP